MIQDPEWITFFRKNDERLSYRYKTRLLDRTTSFQRVEIVETTTFGRAVFLDESPQSSAADEFIYHEAIVHPALCLIPSPVSVFIAGGGEGAVLREILRHPTIGKVRMVDIDKEFIEIAREYLQPWHEGTFDDPRVELVYADARQALTSETDVLFDCIIIDVTAPKPGSPALGLFTQEFYESAAGRLSKQGILVVQAQSVNSNNLEAFACICKTLSAVFPHVFPYSAPLPFDGDTWGFILASRAPIDPVRDDGRVDDVLSRRGCKGLRFYDGETHRGMFSLPKHVRAAITDTASRVITDSEPFVYGPC